MVGVAMQDARRQRAGAVVATLVALVVASGCGGGGSSNRGAVETDATPVAARRVASTTTATTTPVTDPTPMTAVAAAAPVVPATSAPPSAPPIVTVSVAALESGRFTSSDGAACSNISSQSLAKGRLELRRTGSTAAALTVRYAATGTAADFTPLSGVVTIPAGASVASVEITPTIAVGPAPQHVHRSSSVSIAVQDDPAYDLGSPASAAVTLTFDVDQYGCDTPAP